MHARLFAVLLLVGCGDNLIPATDASIDIDASVDADTPDMSEVAWAAAADGAASMDDFTWSSLPVPESGFGQYQPLVEISRKPV